VCVFAVVNIYELETVRPSALNIYIIHMAVGKIRQSGSDNSFNAIGFDRTGGGE